MSPTISKTTGSIVKRDEEQQIVTGAALVPDRPDKEGDVVRKDTIETVAYDYMARHQTINENHDQIPRDEHAIVESYIAPQDLTLGGTELPEGTWVLSAKLGDQAWRKVKSGEFSGFSIEGRGEKQ